MYNIGLGRVIEEGRVTRLIKSLEWRKCNGIIIPGQSGSGKTNTAVHYMSQYAAQGVKLIVCDYNGGLEQTLSDQIEHLSDSFLWDPVVEGEDIVAYIDRIHALGQERLQRRDTNHFPILFVVDEFSSFISNTPVPLEVTKVRNGDTTTTTRKAQYMQRFVDALTTTRKVDIKFMVMGQNWVQAGTTSSVRQFRDNFNTIVFHKLSHTDAKLFTSDPQTIRQIESLKPGLVMHENTLLRLPLVSETEKLWAEKRIRNVRHLTQGYTPTGPPLKEPLRNNSDTDLLGKLLAEVLPEPEVVTEVHWKAVEAIPRHSIIRANPPKEGTVELLPKPETVRQTVVQNVPATLVEIITRIKRGESNYKIAKEMYNTRNGRRLQVLSAGFDKIRRKIYE